MQYEESFHADYVKKLRNRNLVKWGGEGRVTFHVLCCIEPISKFPTAFECMHKVNYEKAVF